LTNNSGSVTDSYVYTPFGKVMAMQQTTANPFRYIGQFGVMDEDSGLNYVRARYYSSTLGRFISKDPLEGNSADSQSFNRYAYGLNNPVRFVDVSGLSASEGGMVLGVNTESSDFTHNNLFAFSSFQEAITGTAKFATWLGKKATGILGIAEKIGGKSYGAGSLSKGYAAVDLYETHVENQALVQSGEVVEEFSKEREAVNHLLNFALSQGVGGGVDDLSGGAVGKRTMKTLDTTVINRSRDVCLQAGEPANCLK
jgi:RHS repeat-associated protein